MFENVMLQVILGTRSSTSAKKSESPRLWGFILQNKEVLDPRIEENQVWSSNKEVISHRIRTWVRK